MRAAGDPTRVSCAPVLTAIKAAPLRCSETHDGRGPSGRSRSAAHIYNQALIGCSKSPAGGGLTAVSCASRRATIKAAPLRCSKTTARRVADATLPLTIGTFETASLKAPPYVSSMVKPTFSVTW
ncbi:hypothetical protein GCM10023157_31110 [Gluconacetobacter asukensis]